jgi:peptide/nickel transport system ATP-binding protein
VSAPLLRIEGLKTWFHTDEGTVKALDGVSIDLHEGETLGVVGESGSGKSVTALSVMRLLPESMVSHPNGRIAFLGRDLLALRAAEMTAVRGRDIGMIFQEPMTSLNPVMRVGDQVAEAIWTHERVPRHELRARTLALFQEVGLPEPERRLDTYPHEMSGGQKQRVMIAMALACNPKLLIADEPTTALDVTIQRQILDLLRELQRRRGMSILFITHDLGVVAELAHRVAVMYQGLVVETGDVLSIFERPQHPYTKSLLACRPSLDTRYARLPTVADFMEVRQIEGRVEIVERPFDPQVFLTEDRLPVADEDPPLLQVRDLNVHFPVAHDLLGRPSRWVRAVDGVSFTVRRGETLGLVGESGCGKTTTGRAVLRLIRPTAGEVLFQGRDLAFMDSGTSPEAQRVRRDLQIVFQDPYASLNPRQSIEQILTEPMQVHGIGADHDERVERARALLEEVGLDPNFVRRYPHQFSGGQRQRIGIARALSLEPRLIVCDESVSALDVSVQAQVLNLLRDLQRRRGLTYLFISHDLSVVKFMSDRLAVMRDGKIVETGPADQVYEQPQDPYTRDLIAAIPDGSVAGIRRRLGTVGK